MSRWLVGSSSSSRSGCEASARRERGPRQLAARERRRAAGRGRRRRTRARGRPRRPGRASRSRRRARAWPARSRSGRIVRASWAPAAIACLELAQLLPRARPGRPCRRARTRGAAALARRRRPLVVERDARPLLPRELAALERHLPASGPAAASSCRRRSAPASASRSRRSTLNDDAVEERVARELLAQPGCDQDCHGPIQDERRLWHDPGDEGRGRVRPPGCRPARGVLEALEDHDVIDLGTAHAEVRIDYPDKAREVGRRDHRGAGRSAGCSSAARVRAPRWRPAR